MEKRWLGGESDVRCWESLKLGGVQSLIFRRISYRLSRRHDPVRLLAQGLTPYLTMWDNLTILFTLLPPSRLPFPLPGAPDCTYCQVTSFIVPRTS